MYPRGTCKLCICVDATLKVTLTVARSVGLPICQLVYSFGMALWRKKVKILVSYER